MNSDFLERLAQRARAEHGLPPSTAEDEDFNPIRIDLSDDEPVYEEDRTPTEDEEANTHMVDGGAESSDHHPGQPELRDQPTTEDPLAEELQGGAEEPDDDDDDATTDSDEENRPKKPEVRPTIRLTLDLDPQANPSTVKKSVSLMAKEAGYALPTDTAIALGASTISEPEPPVEPVYNHEDGPPPKRRRRKRRQERDEGYDRDDPFVDDSEALMMEPKFYHPPARDGFFVASGLLELKSDTKKTKTRKPNSKVAKRIPLSTTAMGDPSSLNQTARPSTSVFPLPTNTGMAQLASPLNHTVHLNPPDARPPRSKSKSIGFSSRQSPVGDDNPSDISKRLSMPTVRSPNALSPSTPKNDKSLGPMTPVTSRNSLAGEGIAGNPITLDDDDDDGDKQQSRCQSRQHTDSEKPSLNVPQSSTSELKRPLTGSRIGPSVAPSLPPLAQPSVVQAEASSVPLLSRASIGAPTTQGTEPTLTPAKTGPNKSSTLPATDPSNTSTSRPSMVPSTSQLATPQSRLSKCSYLKMRPGSPRRREAPLASELEAAILKLKVDVDAALPFSPKSFPSHLTPLTLEVAQLALDLREYDSVFFNRLAEIFPYNTFTIKKLVKREILPQRQKYYDSQIDQRIDRLKILVTAGMELARNEYEGALKDYSALIQEHEDKMRGQAPETTDRPASPGAPTSTHVPATFGEAEVGAPNPGPPNDKMPKPPTKNFKFTPAMRELYYEILKLEDERGKMMQDTQAIVHKNVTWSDMGSRKLLIQRLCKLWPDDFMTTTRLSREATNVKKKYDAINESADPVSIVDA